MAMKIIMMFIGFLFLSLSLGASIETLSANDYQDNMIKGKLALEKYKDCPSAFETFSSVSEIGQNKSEWVLYMAKTTECLGKYEDAYGYYGKYEKMAPNNANIHEKVLEMQYLMEKSRKDSMKKQEMDAKLEEKRKEMATKKATNEFFSKLYECGAQFGEMMVQYWKCNEDSEIARSQKKRGLQCDARAANEKLAECNRTLVPDRELVGTPYFKDQEKLFRDKTKWADDLYGSCPQVQLEGDSLRAYQCDVKVATDWVRMHREQQKYYQNLISQQNKEQ